MYVPSYENVQDQATLYGFMRQFSFATLVTSDQDGLPVATHVPFLIEEGLLKTHVARANPHWRKLGGRESLVIFQGDHGYISPRYYESDHRVPTWNYQAVHVYGTTTIVDDPAAVRQILATTTSHYEGSAEKPWQMSQISEESIESHLKALVAMEIHITRIQGKWKLGQSGSKADRAKSAGVLLESTNPSERATGQAMLDALER
jgi:transcriptional regulator